MSYLRAVMAAFHEQWRTSGTTTYLLILVGPIAPAAALAWIATSGGNSVAATYMICGIFLMAMSDRSVFDSGWTLSGEISGGTLQYSLISRTPSC